MEFLKIQRLCLSSIGYSFENNESRLRQVYSLLMWMLLFVLVFPEIHFVVENISNIPLATDALCPLLTSILSLSKVMTLYFKKNGFYRIIKQLDDMWMKSSESDRLILQKGHKIDKRLTLTYLISSVSVAILYLLFPIVKAIFELQSTGSTVWIMPMRSIFLYDISVSPNYYLTYLWFIQSTYLAAIGSVGIDCLFYGSAFNISSHFEIIQRKVRNRTFDSTQHDDINERRVTPENFFGIINYHQQVLSICKEFQRLYSVVLFTQFLITSVQLCVIAFQLTLPNQQVMLMAIFVLFLSAICFQLFTYCHAGSQLTTEVLGQTLKIRKNLLSPNSIKSLAVADAIYDSCWYEASTTTARHLVAFFLMRSQKGVIMSSGYYVANLETLKAILSTAGSYITLLQSLSEDK